MKVTVLIADDEPVARAGMRAMLADAEWLAVIGEASNGIAAVEDIDRLQPDLVFLDIQMPGMLGTDVLAKIRHTPYVVFTTAYAEHAVTGFELGALDYLLKPFGAERLGKCLERVRAAIGEASTPSPLSRFADAMSNGPMTRLFVRAAGGIIPVDVRDVSWFEASGDYVTAHSGRTRYMLHLSLGRLESRLDSARFIRIHRAHMVNLDHVTSFKRRDGGRLVAQMDDGSVVAVSRERAKELRLLGV